MTKFQNVLGNSAQVRILELFIEGEEEYYNPMRIVKATHTSTAKVYPILKKFYALGIITKKNDYHSYTLKKSNRFSKLLIKLFDIIIKEDLDGTV